jgi:hypothetical protein
MNKVDVFEIVVRSIGLLIFLRGASGVFHVTLLRSGISKWNSKASPKAYLSWIVAYLLAGVFLMFYAEGIARMFTP